MNMPIYNKEGNRQYSFKFCGELGMTLVELMAVVVIIGVLATLIFPSFEKQILAARRRDAITHLLRLKIKQETFRIQNVSYAKTEQLGLPKSKYYTFIITDVSATTYTISAKVKGSQVSDKKCLVMQINQSLNKTPAHCF